MICERGIDSLKHGRWVGTVIGVSVCGDVKHIVKVGQRGTTIWIPLNLQPDCEISREILIVRGFISSKEGKYYSYLSPLIFSDLLKDRAFTLYSL